MNDAILRKEYQDQKQKVQYCTIGKETLIIPINYKDNIDRFTDDLFGYEEEAEKYRKHNQHCSPEERLDPQMLSSGDVSFLPPFDLVKSNCSQQEIIKKSNQRALRKYRAAIKKINRHNEKEYPNTPIPVKMDKETLAEVDKKHQRYCADKLLQKFGQAAKFSAKQIAQMSAGAAGILPVIAYHFMDKKFHFAKSKTKETMDKKIVPYICKGALKSFIPLAMYSGAKIGLEKSKNSPNNNQAQNNITIVQTPQKTTEAENAQLNKKYKIDDLKSFHQLYNDALNFMTLSMFPTEVLVNEAYTDNGKTINTIGLGSFWFPKNGNPQSSEWILTSDYVKKNKIKLSGPQAIELTDGWYRHRENGRVYKDMYKRLKGCELKAHEFAAIATVMYNNEVNGKELCDFVKKNYKNPTKCAAKIMELKPQNARFNDGILKRHAHEALIYLNCNDYAEKIPYFMVKKGTNSKGKTYYVTSVTQLSPQDCRPMQQALENGNTKEAELLAQKIENYRCKDGKTVYKIADQNNISHLYSYIGQDVSFYEMSRMNLAENSYQQALDYYKNKDYEQALSCFKNMRENGFDGADIHNDMAITYYNLGEYENCIKECQEVLKTGEKELYPAANYNAGKAYEKLGNPAKALKNYQLAQQRDPDEKAYQSAVLRLSKFAHLASNNAKSRG